MTGDEVAQALSTFAAPVGNTTDTVWRARLYAPMLIHTPALSDYRSAIERAFPDHIVTFDVVFAAAEGAVPWHCDFDSLGPFEAGLGSIAREDFITVHANLVQPDEAGGGRLRTLDSLGLAALHFLSNQLVSSFGSLGRFTEPFAARLGARTHDGTPGLGNAFNNLKVHGVTAGAGRISYVVRLVRRNVLLSRDKVRAAAGGTGGLSTRRIREFERFLPLMARDHVPAGAFAWASVKRGYG